ncbi:MAG: hypothetical protein COA67_03450 [Lutibacter sp.]|nr:MAG: hypothetical protein COA67_03450 [Lutibacter sp.]
MKFYYVYILKSSDSLLYTGITNDLSRRIIEHNKGNKKTSFTYIRRHVKLIFYQEFNDVNQAIFFEKKLALANGDFDLLKLLSECRNNSHSNNKI